MGNPGNTTGTRSMAEIVGKACGVTDVFLRQTGQLTEHSRTAHGQGMFSPSGSNVGKNLCAIRDVATQTSDMLNNMNQWLNGPPTEKFPDGPDQMDQDFKINIL